MTSVNQTQNSSHSDEVNSSERFRFGDNWRRFLEVVDDERIELACNSLRRMLEVEDLTGKSFLDVGSGSGLFSLAARKLGATVVSFDYDPESVACTSELKSRYFPDDSQWNISEASALDTQFMKSLSGFDIVYSWGVLHHTGSMWLALENVAHIPVVDGKLFIAIYNDQGGQSVRWTKLKAIYNKLPEFLKMPYTVMVMGPRELKYIAIALLRGQLPSHFRAIKNYAVTSTRGMNYWRDIIDWIGGYPFEVAKPEQIFDFYRLKGYELLKMKTLAGGSGCNEYVFCKKDQTILK